MKALKSYYSKISSNIDNIGGAVKDVVYYLQDLYGGLDENIIYEIKVILNELVINAVKHGNKLDENKYVTLEVKIVDNGYAVFIIEDEGEGYNCKCLMEAFSKNKDVLEILELCDMKETGRGLLIVKNLSERLRFNNKGNKVVVLKKLSCV